MARITGSYPEDLDLLIEGAVEAGIFGGKSDALREFVRTYFEDHENERIAAAIALYEREEISLGEAARLAAVDRWTMRDLLREHGVDLRVGLGDADEAADEAAAATELEFEIERMKLLVAETAPQSKETAPVDDIDSIAQKHRDAVRRGAETKCDE